ncbi:MAG TPA: hypothetical protein VIC27_05995 [Ktedonobacterales bacterium]|jgi:hypothetical protein
MQALRDLADESLVWVRVGGLHERYELRVGVDETAIASLTMQGAGGGQAQIGETTLRFRRSGLLGQRVTVEMDASEAPVAVYTGGGSVELTGGATYRWRKPRFWTNERDWVDASGQTIIRMRPTNWRDNVRVVCEPAAHASSDGALLVILGKLLLALSNQDATTAATITAVIGGA